MRALDTSAVNLPVRRLEVLTYNTLPQSQRRVVNGNPYAYVNGEWALIRLDKGAVLELVQIRQTIAAGSRAARRMARKLQQQSA
jgi:hypothetical protein